MSSNIQDVERLFLCLNPSRLVAEMQLNWTELKAMLVLQVWTSECMTGAELTKMAIYIIQLDSLQATAGAGNGSNLFIYLGNL